MNRPTTCSRTCNRLALCQPTPSNRPLKKRTPPAPPLKYQLGTTVPRNWIPFIPVNISAGSPQIRLQKAAMPEFITRYGDTVVPSRTSLLNPTREDGRLFINEEEVPRAGAIVKRQFNRTRWYNGRVFTWIAKRKEAGRGEGSSGFVLIRFREVGFKCEVSGSAARFQFSCSLITNVIS